MLIKCQMPRSMALNLKCIEPHFREKTLRQKKMCLLKHVGRSGCDVSFLFEMHKHTYTYMLSCVPSIFLK